jgi:signal transduction histidine kinase
VSLEFVAGVLTAWTVTHLGLSLFFALAYVLGRKQEYLLFGALSAALSLLTLGMATDHLGTTLEARRAADLVIYSGAILAAGINFHFAYSLAFPGRTHRAMWLVYAVMALFLLVNFSGGFWREGSYRVISGNAFGIVTRHAIAEPSWVAISFFVVGSLETLAAFAFLLRAYTAGRREVLTSLLGAGLVLPALGNDVGIAIGLVKNSFPALPHAFLAYAFGVAGSLLWRYRLAAGELEATASSLRQRTEELRHSYAELREVQNELVTKKQLAAVGELAAAIAHEVRNPLAVIVNAVAGLRRSGISDDDRSMLLRIVEEEAGRLNRLVTDLLRFARPVSVKRTPVALLELANRCRLNAGESFDVRVSIEDDPEVQTVDVDPNLFRIVFDNLVSNACQSMGTSGVVEIKIGRGDIGHEPAVRIEIRDSGHGMEPQVLERALDPFFTTRPSGTGLGLPIVHRIVEAHGGEIVLDSDEGEGTTVTLLVPMRPPAPAQQQASPSLA